jgi:hypothetical protein
MTKPPARQLLAFAAVFTVSDVGRSLEFYLNRLGFHEFFRLGDPPSYAIAERDAVSLHLMPASQEAPRALQHLCVHRWRRCTARRTARTRMRH